MCNLIGETEAASLIITEQQRAYQSFHNYINFAFFKFLEYQ